MAASTQVQHAIFHQGNQSRIDHTGGAGGDSVGDIIYLAGLTRVITSPEGVASGALGAAAIDGIFKVKKDTGTILFALGAIVEWDVAGETAQVPTAGDGPIGIATKAALVGDQFVETWLNKINLPA